MKDENPVLRARAQAAIVRTLATEMQREDRAGNQAEGLREQAVEESARLVSVVEGLSRMRAAAPRATTGEPRQEGPSAGPRGWPRVLVVEDDDATRSAITQGLAPEYEVVAASNGIEGLKAATELPFDVIVADISMPEMDGIAMVDRIRRMRASAAVPVVFLSGETAPQRVAAGFAAGGTSYLVKPVDLELLDQELRWVLGTPGE